MDHVLPKIKDPIFNFLYIILISTPYLSIRKVFLYFLISALSSPPPPKGPMKTSPERKNDQTGDDEDDRKDDEDIVAGVLPAGVVEHLG